MPKKSPIETAQALLETIDSRWTPEAAQALLELQRKSKLSITAFAQALGLKPKRLYWWQQQLRERPALGEDQPFKLAPLIPIPSTKPPRQHHLRITLDRSAPTVEVADLTALDQAAFDKIIDLIAILQNP